jgi:hypothetical protein
MELAPLRMALRKKFLEDVEFALMKNKSLTVN